MICEICTSKITFVNVLLPLSNDPLHPYGLFESVAKIVIIIVKQKFLPHFLFFKQKSWYTLPSSRNTLQRPMYRAFEAREGKWMSLPLPSLFWGRALPWEPWDLKTGGRREGEASYPPVAQPFVHRHSKQKGNHGRVVSKFIRVVTIGTINAEGQSVASGLWVRRLRTGSPPGRTN